MARQTKAPTRNKLLEFAKAVAKCDTGANAQFNYVIELARELIGDTCDDEGCPHYQTPHAHR